MAELIRWPSSARRVLGVLGALAAFGVFNQAAGAEPAPAPPAASTALPESAPPPPAPSAPAPAVAEAPPPGAPGASPVGPAPAHPPAGPVSQPPPYAAQPYGPGYGPQPYPQPYPPYGTQPGPAQPYPGGPSPWPATAAPPPAPAAKRQPPLVIYGWDPDVPPPAGYELDADVNGGLIGAGIALHLTGYLLAVLVGVGGSTVEEEEETQEPALEQDSTSPSDWNPMYIPLVGPFVAIESLDARGWGLGLLVADGVVQAAGILGIVVGALDRRHKIVAVGEGVSMTPVWGPGMAGVALRGRMQ